jgi:hypothetical protein
MGRASLRVPIRIVVGDTQETEAQNRLWNSIIASGFLAPKLVPVETRTNL